MDEWDDECSLIVLGTIGTVIVLSFLVMWIWFTSVQESRTYNKLTGANTTPWDAVWVELRVVNSP